MRKLEENIRNEWLSLGGGIIGDFSVYLYMFSSVFPIGSVPSGVGGPKGRDWVCNLPDLQPPRFARASAGEADYRSGWRLGLVKPDLAMGLGPGVRRGITPNGTRGPGQQRCS